MKPVSMRLPKDKAKEMTAPMAAEGPSKGPRYPWGLQLRLENESLEKLGITELPEAGAECKIVAIGKVVSVEKRDVDGGETRRHVEIQITKLAINHDDASFEKGFDRGPKRSKGY
jgi:hypothetical protein